VTDPTPASPEHADATVADSPAMPAPRTDSEPYNPWSREAETVAVPVSDPTGPLDPTSTIEVSTAVFAATGELSDVDSAAAEGRPKRRRRTPIVLGIATVVVLLLGYGAYAGARLWTGAGIKEPESAVPASVSVFLRADLKPGYRDQLAFDGLMKKFPTGKSTQNLLDDSEGKVAKAAGLDFARDVKPWFGGQVGVALWTNASGQEVVVLAFASKDDTAAKAALAKVKAKETTDDFGYVLSDGYAIVTGETAGAQADAAAVAAEAKAHNLADSAAYTSARAHISGNNLVIVYVDMAKLGKLISSQLGALTGAGSGLLGGTDPLGGTNPLGGAGALLPGMMAGESAALSKLSGTVIAGVSIVDDGVEVRSHAEIAGGAASTGGKGADVLDTMKAMSGTTAVGAAIDGADPQGELAKQLPQLLSSLPQLLGAAGAAGVSGPDSTETAAALQALSGPIQSIVTAKVISLSVSGMTAGKPDGSLRIDFQDAASAQSTMSAIQSLTGGAAIPGIDIAQDGTAIKATMGTPGSGKLGDDALFAEATNGMTNEHGMVYVDMARLITMISSTGGTLSATDKAQIAPIKAIAYSFTSAGSSADTLTRIIIK
jgi:hypothetical protein